jgi:hypothetical protein
MITANQKKRKLEEIIDKENQDDRGSKRLKLSRETLRAGRKSRSLGPALGPQVLNKQALQ